MRSALLLIYKIRPPHLTHFADTYHKHYTISQELKHTTTNILLYWTFYSYTTTIPIPIPATEPQRASSTSARSYFSVNSNATSFFGRT